MDCLTTQPVCLLWRDARAVVEDLLGNPVFANHMTFDPHIVMRGAEREYSEFFTADQAHQIQVCVLQRGNFLSCLTPLLAGPTFRGGHDSACHYCIRQDPCNAPCWGAQDAPHLYYHR